MEGARSSGGDDAAAPSSPVSAGAGGGPQSGKSSAAKPSSGSGGGTGAAGKGVLKVNVPSKASEPRGGLEQAGSPVSSGSTSTLYNLASKAFKISANTVGEKYESAANLGIFGKGGNHEKKSSFYVTQRDVESPHHPTIPKGSPSGYLFRNFTMLHKYECLFYVLDLRMRLMYEFDSENAPRPRTVLSLQNARLEDELLLYRSSSHALYCWKIFFRSDVQGAPARIYILGTTCMEQANEWLGVLRTSIVSTQAGGLKSRLSIGNMSGDFDNEDRMSASRDGDVLADDMSGDDEEQLKSWKQTVVLNGNSYQIPCSTISTNAWLLSETIRTHMRESNDKNAPDVVGLYNITQQRMLDLGDDVQQSVRTGDVLETTRDVAPIPDVAAPSAANAKRGRGKVRASTPKRNTTSSSEFKDQTSSSASVSSKGRTAMTSRPYSLNSMPHHEFCKLETLFDNASLLDGLRVSCKIFGDDRNSQYAKLVLQLERITDAMNNEFPFWPSNNWCGEEVLNGVRIYSNKRKHQGTLAMASIPCSPRIVVETMLDIAKQPDWDPTFKYGRYLEAGKHADVVYIETNNVLPMPFFRRSYCISRFWSRLSDGSYIVLCSPSVHPGRPKASGGPCSGVFNAGFVIRPCSTYDGCVIIAVYNVDIKCNQLVAGMANKITQQAFASSLGGLKEACSI
mmetsp:Transcript_5039/g.7681  ORF Transcript_5039/g.7681 Transcript_5039/m.7681 type:complete len:680 (-) Transcript_5039:47-2086(-)